MLISLKSLATLKMMSKKTLKTLDDMAEKMIDGILIGGISLPLDADESEAKKIAANEIKRAGISPARINFNVYKRSIDARKKDDIRLVYSIAAKFDEPRSIKLPKSNKYPISELHSD